eukprot:6346401-Amphidinium_carterae.1
MIPYHLFDGQVFVGGCVCVCGAILCSRSERLHDKHRVLGQHFNNFLGCAKKGCSHVDASMRCQAEAQTTSDAELLHFLNDEALPEAIAATRVTI